MSAPQSKSKQYFDDRYLVAEQPGLAIISSVIAISFFIGFAFKSYFNSSRVTSHINMAASQIHSDVKIKFDKAELVLFEGVLPTVQAVVSKVRVESNKPCWMAPEIFISELKLPLSIWGLISGDNPISAVNLGAVTINLRKEHQTCDGVRVKAEAGRGSAPAAGVFVEKKESRGSASQGSPLESITARSVRINYIPNLKYKGELTDLRVQILSHQPRRIRLDANTSLVKDEKFGDFLANSKVHAEFQEEPEKSALIHFFGNLREGYYSLISKYSFVDEQVNLEAEMKHIPLGAVLDLLKRFEVSTRNLDPSNLWLTTKASSTFNAKKAEEAPLVINHLQVEGDVGVLKSQGIFFKSLKPLEHEPLRIDIERLDIQKLFEIYGRPHPSKALGRLGDFSGVAEIRQGEQINLVGNLQGLEFIFSNRGNRELQIIDNMSTDVSFSRGLWKMKINRVSPRNGSLVGEVNLESDRYFTDVKLDLSLEELQLSPSVQRLMTIDGYIKPLKGSVVWNLKDGVSRRVKGQLQFGGFKAGGVEVGPTRAQIGYGSDAIQIKGRADDVHFKRGDGLEILRTFYPQAPEVNFESIEGQFEIKSANEMLWSGAVGRLNSKSTLMTTGGWTRNGELFGRVERRQNQTTKSWLMRGLRSQPVFQDSKESSRR